MPLKRARQVELAALVVSDIDVAELKTAIFTMCEPYTRPRRIRVAAEIHMLPNEKVDWQRIEKLHPPQTHSPKRIATRSHLKARMPLTEKSV
jgi:hypothetical protein